MSGCLGRFRDQCSLPRSKNKSSARSLTRITSRISYFVAVVQNGGFSAASRTTGLEKTARLLTRRGFLRPQVGSDIR